jgi:hypothetical protein
MGNISWRVDEVCRSLPTRVAILKEVPAINFFQDPCRITFNPKTEGLLLKGRIS